MSDLPALHTLSLDEKVGQLFQIGFPGTEPTSELRELITEYHVGGVIYFSRNIESMCALGALSEDLQRAANVSPLIISIDEEGGPVSRLPDGVHLPSQMAIGATGDPENAKDCGIVMARQLRSAGINMNLAPVLDVNTDPENPIIGSRAYGDDPHEVGRFGTAYVEGLQSEGVSACGKHFPGHGDTSVDSHLDLPVVAHARERLEEVELTPFRAAIAQGIDSLMSAHVSFPAIEPDPNRPATLSSAVLTELLRKELGFSGLIITDCLEMKAIEDRVGPSEGAVQAIDAGTDMVLLSHTPAKQRAAIEAVLGAVRDGRLSEQQIDSAARRIFEHKARRILSNEPAKPHDHEFAEAIADHIALDSVTVVRDESSTLPLRRGAVTLVRTEDQHRPVIEEPRNSDWESVFADRVRLHGLQVTYVETTSSTVDSIDPEIPAIVLCQDATDDATQRACIADLASSLEQLVVLAVWNPYDIQILPEETTYVTCYDQSPACLRAAADVITGNAPARGRLPVSLGAGVGRT